MFDFTNTSGATIVINKVHQAFFVSGIVADVQVWSKAGGIGTDPTNASGQWFLEGSNTGIVSSGPSVAVDLMINLTGGMNMTLNPGQTVGIYVTTTNAQVVSYTVGTAVGAVYASNADCSIHSGYGGTYPFGSQFAPRNANVEVYYTLSGATPTVQTNRSVSSFDISGATGNGFLIGRRSTCTNRSETITLASTLPAGTPYDLVIQAGAAANPGLPFTANIVNVNLATGLPILLSTGASGPPPGPSPLLWPGIATLGLPFTTPLTAVLAHAQAYWVDPGNPDGVSLSAPCELDVVQGAALTPVTLADDATAQIPLGAPTCAPMTSFSFYGTSYTSFFISSNGQITFGQGDANWTASTGSFHSLMPRICPMWTDLDPSLGGTITVATSGIDVTVAFNQVPTWGQPANTNSFAVSLDTAGQTTILNYAPSAVHALGTLVGISNGSMGTAGTAVSFDALKGIGPQAGIASDSVYEFAPNGPVPNASGFTQIIFPNSDGSLYVVF